MVKEAFRMRGNDETGPCLGCEERIVGCHAACDRFIQWSGQRKKQREERNKSITLNSQAYFRKREAVEKYNRKNRR